MTGGKLRMEFVSRLSNSLSFSGRGIPSGGVAPPSDIPDILGRRALPAGRRAPENLPRNLRDATRALRAALLLGSAGLQGQPGVRLNRTIE